MFTLLIHYGAKFGLIRENEAAFDYFGVVLIVPAVIAAAYYGNKLLFPRRK
jgi:hypothetical protein